jgi:hypothetical protein
MNAIAVSLLCALLAGCAAPVPSPTTSPSVPPAPSPTASLAPAPRSPVSSPAIALTCLGLEPVAPSPAHALDCQPEEAAVLLSVARLGYPVRGVTIGLFDFGCGGPFATGVRACPAELAPSGGAAYVTFIGTQKVAAVTLTAVDDPPLTATVWVFEVPPAGWTMP